MDRLESKVHIILITLIYIGMITPLACLGSESWICSYSINNFYLTVEHLMIGCVGIFLRRAINSFRNRI